MPWSVQLSDRMNVGMRSSMGWYFLARRSGARTCEVSSSRQRAKIGAEFRNAMPAGGTIAAHRNRNESSARSLQGRLMPSLHPKHDPEKLVPVFGKDHAQTRS